LNSGATYCRTIPWRLTVHFELATASSDEVVDLWDTTTGAQRGALTGHTGGATDVAFLADGVTLVVVDRTGRLHLWDARTGRRLSEAWQGHAGPSWRIAVHPDGERFATTGDDGSVILWDPLSVARLPDRWTGVRCGAPQPVPG